MGGVVKAESANETAGYTICLPVGDATHKDLQSAHKSVSVKCWVSRDISAYANSEFDYAMFPVAIGLFWNHGGGGFPHIAIGRDLHTSRSMGECKGRGQCLPKNGWSVIP